MDYTSYPLGSKLINTLKMKKALFTFIILMCVLASQAQYIHNNGAHITSTSGSYWVIDNSNFSLTSESSAAPTNLANLKIEGDASLTISPKSYLTVTGTLINNAGNSGLVIQSNAESTASLIHASANVSATVSRYLPGVSQSWHLLSSPMVAQPIDPAFTANPATAYDFFSWYEPAVTWVNFKNTSASPTWNTANGSTNMLPGKGYLVEYDGTPLTKLFGGSLNEGEVSIALTKSGSGTYSSYNLAGNPFASAIDWKAASGWDRSSLTESGGGYVMSIWNDALSTGNYGEFNSAAFSGTGTNGASQYIPVGQGFMVKANSSGTLTMNNEVRVHSNQAYLKSTDAVANILRMKVSGDANTYSDEIIIEFGHQAPDGGAEKMNSFYEAAPSLYTIKPDGNYSIDFRGEAVAATIPIGFKAGVDGKYSITASQLESFAPATAITLEDLKLATTQNLSQNPVYNFVAEKNDNSARFLLHFGSAFGMEEDPKDLPFTVYSSGNTVYIANASASLIQGHIYVYSTLGQTVLQEKIAGGNLTTISLNVSAGYYLVKVVTDADVYTTKVFISR